MAEDFGLPEGFTIPACGGGPTGSADDPLCVIVKPGDEPIVVTIDPAQFEDLCDKFETIVTAIEENRPIFDGDALPTPYCTPDGDPVYLCKKTDVATGESTYEYQIVPEDASEAEAYTGPRELCETPTTKLVEICVDWCMSGVACVASDDPSNVISYTVVDPEGVWTTTEGAPTGPHQIGACPTPTKVEKSVWTFPEDSCPKFVRSVTALCYGPKLVTEVDGVLTPLFETLGEGEVFQPADAAFGKCVTCLVAPAEDGIYPADSLSDIQVFSTSCEYVCETGEYEDPTTVTVDGVTHVVRPGDEPWQWPGDPCPCGGRISKEITIEGPHVAWPFTTTQEEC